MLDHFTIKIRNIKSTIGRVGKLNWPEPNVFRSDEFRVDIDPIANHRNTLFGYFLSMEDVASYVMEEHRVAMLEEGVPMCEGANTTPQCLVRPK